MEVMVDPEVQNLLLEPPVSSDTVFDLWFHKLIATSGGDYNDV